MGGLASDVRRGAHMKQTCFFLAYRAPKDGALLSNQEKTPVDVQSANSQSLDELRRLIPEIKGEFEPAKLETAAGEIGGLKASLGFVAAQGWYYLRQVKGLKISDLIRFAGTDEGK